jgi:transcriptional regulator with XRE-family HTH domain
MSPDYLIKTRKAAKLTQDEMAGFMGLSKRAYSDLETGKTPVRGIHVAAADRVSLLIAVTTNDPMAATPMIRKEALVLASLITGQNA